MSCLKPIVGLSKNDCDCFEGERPEDYNESISGYYLDDKSWGIPLHWTSTVKDCGSDGPWELMKQARDEGIVEYLTLINQYLYEFNHDITIVRDVLVGDRKVSSWLEPEKRYAGLRLTTCIDRQVRTTSNVLVISKVSIHVLNDTPVEFKFLLDGIEAYTGTLNPTGGLAEHVLTTPYIYRPYDNYGNIQKLEVVADMQNNEFRDVKFNCRCNGQNSKHYWETQFDATHIMADDYDNIETSKKYKPYTGGLRITAIHRCDDQDWICNFTKYQHTAFYKVQARIIQLLSIQKMIGHILSSGTINRFTILKREELFGKSKSISNKVKNDLTWLALNIPQGLNKCIECKERKNTRVVQIMV